MNQDYRKVLFWPSGGLGQVTTTTKKKQEKPQGHWTPPFPPLGVQIHYGHSRYVPKWYKALKLVIFLTFDVCAAITPPPNVFSTPFSLWYHGSLIVWIPFPSLIPWSSTCSSTREEERDEIVLTMAWLSYVNFLTKWHLSVILNISERERLSTEKWNIKVYC